MRVRVYSLLLAAGCVQTAMDLLVSVKLFLGRFDMRTMQVR